MLINSTRNDSVLTITIEGKLDTLTSVELKNTLKNSLSGIDSLVLDFAKLDYISSAGLRTILNAHKLMSVQGGMKVMNVNEGVMEILRITGFSNILSIESKS